VTILTDEGGQELVRQKGQEYDSALANWKLGRKVVNVALSEPTGQGTDFIHHGIVLKEKLGLQVSYPESKKPHVVYGLGAIASIVSVKPLDPWVVRQWRTLRTKLFSI
jgi:hypothetical protein